MTLQTFLIQTYFPVIRIYEGRLGKEFPSLKMQNAFKVRGDFIVLEELY